MLINTILIYIVLSIILFFIQDYIDKKNKNNYLDNIIITNIYIIISAGLLKTYNIIDNNYFIFLIAVFELLLRLFYYNYIKEDNYLKNNKDNQNKYILILITTILTNNLFINQTNIVFPKIENTKIIIWMLIIIYLYNYIKNIINNKPKKINNNNKDKELEKIVMTYAKFKNKYYNIVKSKYKELDNLIYAVMIYENNNKSEFMRNIDKLKYKFNHNKRKYGIMQVYSYYPIDDIKSIRLSIKHFERIYSKFKNNNIFEPTTILKKYYKNNDNTDKIIIIYNTIINFNNKY